MMIDEKTVQQARRTDMIAFFEKRLGFAFVCHGGAYRCRQHPSLAVKSDRLSWHWHSRGTGGFGALDYLMKIERLPFRKAVEAVSGMAPAAAQPKPETEQPKTLILPEKAVAPSRLYDYLCRKRGIDSNIVGALVQRGKLYGDRRGNAVFVGYDEHGKARFASVRGTGDCPFRVDCAGSGKRYGFCMAFSQPERLYVFESPIDAMSHASLANAVGGRDAWKLHSRLSLAGTSGVALPFFLNQHPATAELVFCLDNDPVGRKAAALMARKYAEKGLRTWIELPVRKDFNEDLMTALMEKTHTKSALRNMQLQSNGV